MQRQVGDVLAIVDEHANASVGKRKADAVIKRTAAIVIQDGVEGVVAIEDGHIGNIIIIS